MTISSDSLTYVRNSRVKFDGKHEKTQPLKGRNETSESSGKWPRPVGIEHRYPTDSDSDDGSDLGRPPADEHQRIVCTLVDKSVIHSTIIVSTLAYFDILPGSYTTG